MNYKFLLLLDGGDVEISAIPSFTPAPDPPDSSDFNSDFNDDFGD